MLLDSSSLRIESNAPTSSLPKSLFHLFKFNTCNETRVNFHFTSTSHVLARYEEDSWPREEAKSFHSIRCGSPLRYEAGLAASITDRVINNTNFDILS